MKTNDATRATGEALPAMSRRTALATTGASLAAALAGFAAHAAMPSDLTAKIAAHEVACRAVDDAEVELKRLEEANPIPPAQVQLGYVLRGRNDDGTDDRQSIYVTSEYEVRRRAQMHIRAYEAWPGSEAMVATLKERCEKKVAELHQKMAERRMAEDAAGITAARERFFNLGDAEYDARVAIREHEYSSLDDLRKAISHLAQREAAGELGDPDYEVARLALTFAGIETGEA